MPMYNLTEYSYFVITNIAILLTKDNLPGLVSNLLL